MKSLESNRHHTQQGARDERRRVRPINPSASTSPASAESCICRDGRPVSGDAGRSPPVSMSSRASAFGHQGGAGRFDQGPPPWTSTVVAASMPALGDKVTGGDRGAGTFASEGAITGKSETGATGSVRDRRAAFSTNRGMKSPIVLSVNRP